MEALLLWSKRSLAHPAAAKSLSRWQLEFVEGGGGWGKSRPVEIAEL